MLSLFTAFVLKSILSDMSIATPAFFWSLFAWNILFQPFTFSLYVSLFLGGSLVGSIYRGFFFVSIQPVFAFWLGHSTQNNKVNGNGFILINNHLKYKWVECPNQRQRLAEWIYKQDPYICCLQETHLKTRDTYRLKVKGWRDIPSK